MPSSPSIHCPIYPPFYPPSSPSSSPSIPSRFPAPLLSSRRGSASGLAVAVVLGASLASCALGTEPTNPASGPSRGEAGLELDGDEVPAPALPAALAPLRELEASVSGLGLRVSPVVQIEDRDGSVRWRVEGRATVALGSIASWVPDDAYGEAQLTGPRSFAITFRQPSEQNTIASGLPLFVTVSPVNGARAEAAIWFRPRVDASAGSGGGRIRPYATVRPVWVTDEALGHLEYRGLVAVAPAWSLELGGEPASLPSSSGPRLVPLEDHRVRLAWSFSALAATVARSAPQLQLRARHGNEAVLRTAALEIRAVRLALTREDPRQVWPTRCEPAVRACLLTLPSLEADTEACGTYRQVLACGGPAGARERPSDLF